MPCSYRRFEIPVGRGYDSHVGHASPRLADPLELLVLQEAQHLRLDRWRDFAHLVEEQRSTFRRLDAADAVGDRTGESPPGVPEQFARQELLGQRGTAHHGEGPIPPRAHLMQRASEDALARPALAAEQDRHVMTSRARNHFHHGAHRRAGRFEADLRHRVRELLLRLEQAPLQVATRPRRLDHAFDLRWRRRSR